ncbi:uncharacterized protein LOC111901685 [Lactuca sativa]|uniref:DUF4378 domain-containing protein n=1 Tax=Lactuca sativa TaxID=4236 RepID=A0A9R1UHW6_LACSA|nr:uncharacterized protein LOC111901685 [Lactuca sativa]KAJ0187362.1 hypothetical protein LSAT_V11C900478420 [Lactuca sativa]
MGREWLYKAAGGGDASSGRRGKGKPPSTTSKPVNIKTKKERNSSSSGCMSAIFNFFDVQHHQFGLRYPSFISESAINNPQQFNIGLQGVEAPRNSLESPESAMDVAPSSSSSSSVKEKSNLNIPMGGIQIKTKRSRLSDQDLSSEYSSSPSTKTPNLVARLMGLDLLPEYSSPRPSSSSSTPVTTHKHSRSLPATPRISTASRGSTDNDYHHRFSLQIDKENCNSYKRQEHESLQMKMARRRSELLLHRSDDENTSLYAKQIANQVRERISRRLGTDITNTVSSQSSTTRNKEQRRDSNLVLLKPKKPAPSPLMTQAPAPAPASKQKQDDTNTTPFSSSPKLRLLDIKSNLSKPNSNSQSSPFKEVGSKPETRPVRHQKPLTKPEKPVKDQKIQRIASERYELRLKNVRQQDDAFVSKICKKSTPLPNHVVNVKNTTKFLSFKKEMTSSSSTRLPQKQVSLVSMTQLPSRLNSSYNQNDIRMFKLSDQDSNAATTSSSDPNGGSFSDHFDYISRILDLCGIHSTTLISIGQWYSPSHPLHPSIFHQLEKHHHPTTTAGRRLMFELVDELLAEILKPYMNLKPWVCPKTSDSCGMRGSDLIKKLCEKIESIPAADCEVLEDIDGLIERDIGGSMRRLWSTAFEAEAEDIVKEIESEIVETLMHEFSTVTVAPAGSDK